MKKLLLKYGGQLIKGTIIDRPNRFTLRVRIGSSVQRVYLPNPGKLSTVIAPGRKILCQPKVSNKRKTSFTAFAVFLGEFYVTVNSAFANVIFSKVLEKEALEEFKGCTIASREKRIPSGRIDFVLQGPRGDEAYVEVKSSTHVEAGVAKFPDRPTERGRRHLAALSELATEGTKCYITFIIQRPDARRFEPFREVDPEFARMVGEAVEKGVKAIAISTEFKPPNLYLRRVLPMRVK